MSPKPINRHSRGCGIPAQPRHSRAGGNPAQLRHSRAGGNPARESTGTNPQPQQQRPARSAFTLIELILVLAIIGILASALLGALYSTQEAARAQRTKGTIAKLDSAVRSQWDTYRTRRVPVNRTAGQQARPFAAAQLQARWDLQRAEMPDRYDDICQVSGSTLAPIDPGSLQSSLQLAYIDAISQYAVVNGAPDAATYFNTIVLTNQSAECLYLSITVGMNPMDEMKFIESELGDTDDDGMPEFIDGYGEPINFLRWAPGFVSDIQRPNPSLWPDPLDPLGVGRKNATGPDPLLTPTGSPPDTSYGYLIYPVIYSPGPDGAGALMLLGSASTERNPYAFYDYKGTPFQRGALNVEDTTEGGGPYDNIHNHLLGSR